MNKCPTCGSSAPERHPAVQWEGEVEICTDEFHLADTVTARPYHHLVREKREYEIREVIQAFMAQIERLARKDNPGGPIGTWSASSIIGRIHAVESRIDRTRFGRNRVRLLWHIESKPSSRKSIENRFVTQLAEVYPLNLKSIKKMTNNMRKIRP